MSDTLLNVQETSNLVSLVANQAIIQPLGDPYTIGISGLIFDIVGRVGVKAVADVTDHFVEANYAIQDHVALKPMIVTMEGKAAELVNVFNPNSLLSIFSAVGGLTPLAGLSPSFNTQDAEFYSQLSTVASLAQNLANTTASAFAVFSNVSTIVTRQQSVFQYLIGLRNARQLCTVETPFAVFDNMIIEDLDSEQGEETTKLSSFVVRFKQILTVDSIQGISNTGSTANQNTGTTSTTPPVAGGTQVQNSATPVSLGSTSGVAADVSQAQAQWQNTQAAAANYYK